MKLHLPKALRTALLAVVAFASASHTVQASAPAVFDYLVKENTTYLQTVAATTSTSVTLPSTQDSWIVSVAAKAWPATVTDGVFSAGSVIIGNIDVPVTTKDLGKGATSENIRKPSGIQDNQFAVYYSEKLFTLYLITPKKVIKLGKTPGASALTREPFQVTLQWISNGDGTGSLYYTGASLVNWTPQYAAGSYDFSGATVTPGDSSPFKQDRITILDNVELSDAFFTTSVTDAIWLSEIHTTSYAKGSGSDPAGWHITGKADLAQLSGTTADKYEDATGGTHTTLLAGDVVTFVGDEGVIHSATDATYSYDSIAKTDILNGGNSCGIGFGAASGATLTVTRDALDGEEIDDVPTGGVLGGTAVRIVDKGTVKFALEDKDSTISSLTMTEGGTLELNTSADKKVTVSLNAGTVSSGNITRTGAGDLVLEFTAAEKDAKLTSISSTATDSDIIIQTNKEMGGSGSLTAQSISNTNGKIQIYANTTVSESITTTGGNIEIDGVSTVIAGAVSAGQTVAPIAGGSEGHNVEVGYKSELIAEAVTATSSVKVASEASLTAGSIETQTVETTGTGAISANTISATSITAKDITVAQTAHGVLMSGGVAINGNGATVGKIADEASVSIAADSTTSLTVSNMKNSDITVGTDVVMTDATTSGSAVSMSAKGVSAAGTLTAAEVDVIDGYTVAAKELQADTVTAGGTEITGDTGSKAVLSNVSSLTTTAATLGGIQAKTVAIADDYTLNNAAVNATDSMTVGANSVLNGVSIETANGVAMGDNVTLNNTSVKGKMTSTTLNLSNASFAGNGAKFGGASGEAVTVDTAAKGVDSVQITGKMDGDKLTVNHMTLNAKSLVFDKDGESYQVLTPTNKDDITYNPNRNTYQLNIQSYVRATMSVDPNTGEVIITGNEDEAGIKAELSDTRNRSAALGGMSASLENPDDGSPLAVIHDYVGLVNEYDLEDRLKAIDAVAGAATVALADSQRRGVQDVQRNLRNRVIQMGGGTNAGLTTDWQYAGIQAWAQADGSTSSTSGSGDEWGYDYKTWGATVGANFDLTANTVLGMSFSASYGKIDVDSIDRASGNNDAYYLNLFARHQAERWVHLFIFTAGMNDMDLERNVMGYNAKGSTDGTSLSAYYEVGYTFGLNYDYTHIIQPLVNVSMTLASVDGYQEKGTIGNAGIDYAGDDYFYGKVGLGARYQGVLYTTVHERNAVLEARAFVTQDFGDTTDAAKVGFVGGSSFKVHGADTSGTGFELGVGISIPVEQHTTIYADVDYTYAPDYSGVRANLGLRYDF